MARRRKEERRAGIVSRGMVRRLGRFFSRVRHRIVPAPIELVASFVNRSNLLKSWEKTAACEGSASGADGPKNAAITRIPAPYAATESPHFSDRSALV